jgi:acyl carrier protein phosphodiesterase
VAVAASGFVVALGESPSVSGAFAPGEARSWERLIDRLAADRLWTRYDDPAFVAERLFGMLRRRPRLAFPRDALAATTSVLAAARPMVLARAEAVVERVVKGVRAGHGPTRT